MILIPVYRISLLTVTKLELVTYLIKITLINNRKIDIQWDFRFIFLLKLQIIIIILRPILYLVYLCSCLGLVLFLSYLGDPFSIVSLIFITINHIISFKQIHLFFAKILRISHISFGRRKWIIFKYQKFSLRVLLSFCLTSCQFSLGVAYKESV